MDSHVHYYGAFGLVSFLEGAASNFCKAGTKLGAKHDVVGCVLLADRQDQDTFVQFQDSRDHLKTAGWSLRATAESCSLVFEKAGQPRLVLIAGRQLVSSEAVELLALGTTCSWPDGRPLASLLAATRDAGALVVLPWGFGKWWHKRGKLVEQAIRERICGARESLFVGDIRSRPRLLAEPRLLRWARSQGAIVLVGSDPLPFSREANAVGSYGSVVDGCLDLEQPWQSVQSALLSSGRTPERFGRTQSMLGFCWSQATLRVAKLWS